MVSSSRCLTSPMLFEALPGSLRMEAPIFYVSATLRPFPMNYQIVDGPNWSGYQ